MTTGAADSLVSRLLRQFIDFAQIGEATARNRALVNAAETLVRRMAAHLVETDPEWLDGLRKSGS